MCANLPLAATLRNKEAGSVVVIEVPCTAPDRSMRPVKKCDNRVFSTMGHMAEATCADCWQHWPGGHPVESNY